MIKAVYEVADNHYTYLKVSGHAGSAEYGKDLVCASVSSIVFGLMNALDELDKSIDIKLENNLITITNNSGLEVADSYLKLVITQLKTIEVTNGDFIRVERK